MEKRQGARRADDTAHINAVVERDYASRPWWRKFAERWETIVSYLWVVIAATAGVWALGQNALNDVKRQDEVIERLQSAVDDLCGRLDGGNGRFRTFVYALLDGEDEATRATVLSLLDASYPTDIKVCDPPATEESP